MSTPQQPRRAAFNKNLIEQLASESLCVLALPGIFKVKFSNEDWKILKLTSARASASESEFHDKIRIVFTFTTDDAKRVVVTRDFDNSYITDSESIRQLQQNIINSLLYNFKPLSDNKMARALFTEPSK